MEAPEHTERGPAAVDAITEQWRQGDCVVGSEFIFIRGDPEAESLNPDGAEVLEEVVEGLVVVSQTCDIVRSSAERPYVDVSPLVPVPPEVMAEVKAARRPGLAFIPSLASSGLVADLERTMTVTKNVLASRPRVAGWTSDEEIRTFANSLKRKRGRFAFPDDFNEVAVAKLVKRLKEKHGKETKEGAALRRLREIRVSASPHWDAEGVDLFFWFVRSRDDVSEEWHSHLGAWLALVTTTRRFRAVDGQVASLEEMTAADYVSSDVLDLDYLSRAAAKAR